MMVSHLVFRAVQLFSSVTILLVLCAVPLRADEQKSDDITVYGEVKVGNVAVVSPR